MTKTTPSQLGGGTGTARGGLRLVRAPEPAEVPPELVMARAVEREAAAAAAAAHSSRPKASVVRFMEAYADAVDREIKALLDL